MATDTQIEAQRLVSISLTKMAQSRTQRTGVSLHKSLLVATMLQKARFLCMKEVLRMVRPDPAYGQTCQDEQQQGYSYEDDTLIGLTPEEAGIATPDSNDFTEENTADNFEYSYPGTCDKHGHDYLYSECDKENLSPSFENPTYLDLDKTSKDQSYRDKYTSQDKYASYGNRNLKRRRAVCEAEIEEAVQSILPKKTRVSSSYESDSEDSVFLEDHFYDNENCAEEDEENKGMDIDRITSLVSIFSFGGISPTSSTNELSCTNSIGSLTRSSSTPDLCSAQAKETDSLQQLPYLAMTV